MNFKAISLGVAAFVLPVVMIAGTATAALGGQIEGGDIYRVRNVTKSGEFTDPVNADKCETVQFKVRIHNPGPNPLEGVKVGATLPSAAAASHSSMVTVTAANADPKTTTDTAAVNLTGSYKISYVAGSTQLLDANNGVMQTLPDGIVGGQVDVPGGVGVSTQQKRFVQFSAKVDCPEVPVESSAVCKVLDLKVTNSSLREVKATLAGEAANAEITGYRIDFGDGTVVNEATATHKYAKDGTYTVRGTIIAKLADGSVVERTADACAQSVKFEAGKPPVVPPTTPVTPTKLPETGAAGLLGAFVGVSGLSSLGYYIFGRRFNR